MENVLKQAQALAEAILESDEYINMHLAEQAAMKDETATALIGSYHEKRQEIEKMLSDSNLDAEALAKAGQELDEIQNAIDSNEVMTRMRNTNELFNNMMKQVNGIIRFVVTGENPEQESCTGSCASCGGCH